MKPLFLVVFAAVTIVSFTACQKQEAVEKSRVATSLIGSWELRAMQGGMLPGKELAPGNGAVLQFTATHYTKYENNTVVETGTYSLVQDSTVSETVGLQMPAGKFAYHIVLKNDANQRPTFIDLEDDKLSLVTGYFPLDYGVLKQYVRISVLH